MRCKNCGWSNPDGLSRCEKCGAPLTHGQSSCAAPQQNSTCVSQDVSASLKSTVSEASLLANQGREAVSRSSVCPKCGYPLLPGASRCPNCGMEQQGGAQRVSAPSASHSMVGTVNPYAKAASVARCSLQPIRFEDEMTDSPIMDYVGDTVSLNRENTDPLNNTITSRVQAELTCENGVWYVEDKSAQQTTFVQASRRLALQDGDVILMGNRKFVFHSK